MMRILRPAGRHLRQHVALDGLQPGASHPLTSSDADTGYGNPINVIRTVREYEQAGVAEVELVVDRKAVRVEWEEEVLRAEHRLPRGAALPERRVPHREHLVAQLEQAAQDLLALGTKAVLIKEL